MDSKENRLKFYIHDPEGLEWEEFDFYDKEKNIRALEQLVLKTLGKGEEYLLFDIGDAAIFKEYHLEPPKLSIWLYVNEDSGKLMLDFNYAFERAQRIIKFYNRFGKDLVTFLELLNVINDYLGLYGDDYEELIEKWLGVQ